MSPFPQSLIKADTDTQTCFLCKRTKEHWGKGIWKKQWKWICRCFLMGKLSNVDAVSKTSQTSVSAYKFTVMSPQTDRGLLHFSLALFLTDSTHQLGLGVLKLTERRWLRPEFLCVGSTKELCGCGCLLLWVKEYFYFLFFKWLVDSTSFDH